MTGDDGLAVVPMDEDVYGVGWLPGDHTAFVNARHADHHSALSQDPFTVDFP